MLISLQVANDAPGYLIVHPPHVPHDRETLDKGDYRGNKGPTEQGKHKTHPRVAQIKVVGTDVAEEKAKPKSDARALLPGVELSPEDGLLIRRQGQKFLLDGRVHHR